MRQRVTVAKDLTWLFTGGWNIGHVVPDPAFELPCSVEYMSGANAYRHKLAHSVQHEHSAIAQGFHDCGRFIVHLTPLDISTGALTSSRHIMFSAMKVLVESQPIGFANGMEAPPTPMLTCGIIPTAVGWNTNASSHTVIVGMEPFWDFILCWAGIVVEMAVGLALFLLDVASLGLAKGPIVRSIFDVLKGVALGLGREELERALHPGQSLVEWARSHRESGRVPTLLADSPSSWPAI